MSGDEDVSLTLGGASEGPTEGVDWSSVEQVAGHVSRTTLANMQQLWRSHSTAMDGKGKQFAETVYSLHAQSIKEVASMKTFELKPVLAALNSYTTGVRETVLEIFQAMRQADDNFAQAVYQTSRRAFARTLREALEAWDISTAEKLRQLRAAHAEQLEMQRRAAQASTQQRLIAHEAEITKKLKEEHKRKLTQAVTAVANLALAKDQEQQQQQQQRQEQVQADLPGGHWDPGQGSTSSLVPESSANNLQKEGTRRSALQELLKRDRTPRSPRRSLSMGWGAEEPRPGVSNSQLPELAQASPGGLRAGVAGEGPAPTRPGTSALGLEVLSLLVDDDEDSPINNMLACKELEVQLRHAKEDLQEQKLRMDEMNRQMQLQQTDVGLWKDKWIQEGAKSDGIKRECLQIVVKCEQRVTALQQEHLAEMSKRDMLLQRAADTIIRLEAQLASHTGQPLDMRMLPHDTLWAPADSKQSASGGTHSPTSPSPASPGGGAPSDKAYPTQGAHKLPGTLALQGLGLDASGSTAPGLPSALEGALARPARSSYPAAPPAPGGTSSARPSMTGQQSGASQAGPPSEEGSNYFD